MNYQELLDAVTAYTDRFDTEVANNIPLFILMSESRINRVLKTRKQSTRTFTATVTGQEYYALPPDYAGMRDIQLNSDVPSADHSVTSFTYLSPELFNNRQDAAAAGRLYYTIIANQIQIFPKQDAGQTLELVYFQKVPPLSVSNTTNWLSEDYPDIYVSGIVAEIELFTKNYDVAKLWAARLVTATEELDTSDITERWSGSAMTIRVA